MCLASIALNAHPTFRLIIASNRDEFYARPSAAAAKWQHRAGVRGGRDFEGGGSWFAADQSGRFALVTNIRQVPMREGHSRGGLVAHFFDGDASAITYVEAITARAHEFRSFNLLVGDSNAVCFLHSGGGPVVILANGIYALSNANLDTPWPKTEALSKALCDFSRSGAECVDPLWTALADRRQAADDLLPTTGVALDIERSLSAAFIVGERYGTRASTIMTIDQKGRCQLVERRFGPNADAIGESQLSWRLDA